MPRPRKHESAARKARFLFLLADGLDAVQARRQAGIDADRALRIVTETDFQDIVKAIRAGAGPIAVQLEPPTAQAAA